MRRNPEVIRTTHVDGQSQKRRADSFGTELAVFDLVNGVCFENFLF